MMTRPSKHPETGIYLFRPASEVHRHAHDDEGHGLHDVIACHHRDARRTEVHLEEVGRLNAPCSRSAPPTMILMRLGSLYNHRSPEPEPGLVAPELSTTISRTGA
jgi:hypothetical protein